MPANSWFATFLGFLARFFGMLTKSVGTIERSIDIADTAVSSYQVAQRRRLAVSNVEEDILERDASALKILQNQAKLAEFVSGDETRRAQLKAIRQRLDAAIAAEVAKIPQS